MIHHHDQGQHVEHAYGGHGVDEPEKRGLVAVHAGYTLGAICECMRETQKKDRLGGILESGTEVHFWQLAVGRGKRERHREKQEFGG